MRPPPHRRSALLVLLSLISASLLAACAGPKGTEADAAGKPEASAKKASPDTTAMSAGQKEVCDAFLDTVDLALTIHLFRKPSERPQILRSAIAKFLMDMAEAEIFGAETRAKAKTLAGSLPETAPDCDLLVGLASHFEAPSGADMFLFFLRGVLSEFAVSMDPFSAFIPQGRVSRSVSNDTWGAGVRFLDRTDYHLGPNGEGRAPEYLVTQGFYDGSINDTSDSDLKSQTYVFTVNEKKVADLGYDKAVALINYASSDVKELKLGIKRHLSDPEPEPVTVPMNTYRPSSAHFHWIPEAQLTGYIRLTTFFNSVAAQNFKEELAGVVQNNKLDDGRLKALVIDLRGNGGGSTDQATAVLETLLPSRSLVWRQRAVQFSSEGPTAITDNKVPKTGSKNTLGQDPHIGDNVAVLVLVDRGSVSASEMVAAALRDHKRAIIVGERTFGKGIGQQPIPVFLGGRILVSNFFWFSPGGVSYQLEGIKPDREVTDQAIRYQHQKRPSPSTMAEYAAADSLKIPSNQPPIDAQDFKPIESPTQANLQSRLKSARYDTPGSCSRTPDDGANFKETDDCIYDTAVALLKSVFPPVKKK